MGSTAITSPTQAPNTFTVPVSMTAEGDVRVFAMLDQDGNRIMQSGEPVGAWNAPVTITDGGVSQGIHITILVEVNTDDGGGSGGSGGTGDCTDLSISGPVTVTNDYTGEGLAMLMNLDGSGPVNWAWFDVTAATAGGGAATYEIQTCPNLGNVKLTGAIDSNGNGLIDPADTSGAYVTSPDTNGNPIVVSTSDMVNKEIQIPILGSDGEVEDNGLSVVPFVTVSGNLTYEGGRIDGLTAGTSVYVAALKYRPTAGVSSSALSTDAYDVDEFDWSSDINGNTSVAYSLVVPANQTVYLWAYADTDLDGNVNESGEPVASGGTDNGAYESGSAHSTQDLDLNVVGH